MAFHDVFDRWQQGGRDADRLAGTEVLDRLNRADSQVFHNLDSDPEVTDDQREQLLDQLVRDQPATPRAALDRFCEFCRQPDNQLRGAPEPAAQSAVLGHVKSRSAWQRYIEGSHGSSARGFATRRRRSAAMTVDDLLRLRLDQQQILLGSSPCWGLCSIRFGRKQTGFPMPEPDGGLPGSGFRSRTGWQVSRLDSASDVCYRCQT